MTSERAEDVRLPESAFDPDPEPKATEAAQHAARAASFVPLYNGAMQVEWHVGGHDIEIVFDPLGVVESICWGRA